MLATRMRMSGGGPSDNLLPWVENIDVFMTPISHTNWNTNSVGTSSYVYRGIRTSSGAQSDEISYDVVLAAGTWTLEVIHRQNASDGIITCQLDGVTVGTIDAYAASTTFNTRTQISSIAVTSTSKKRLTLVMSSKHASSTGYGAGIHHIQLKRTA